MAGRNVARDPFASPEAQRVAERQRDIAARTLFYHNVRFEYAVTYGPAISAGYLELGMRPPAFDLLSRAEALTEIGRFQRRAESRGGLRAPAQEAKKLLEGLRDLDPELIPDSFLN